MPRETIHIADAMFMASEGYLRSQDTCGVKRERPSLQGWNSPATGSCIGGPV